MNKSEHNNKNILFVVSDYLPNRSGGTIRIEKIIKYMRAQAKCFVFTQELNDVGKRGYIEGVNIFRTNAYNLALVYKKIKRLIAVLNIKNDHKISAKIEDNHKYPGRLADNYFVPDINMFWALICWIRLYSLLTKYSIDAVYSSGPSFSNHLVVLITKLFFKNNIKWIAEFRDPWISNPFRASKKFPFECLDRYLEKMVLKRCDKIIVTSEVYKTNFLYAHDFIDPSKIDFIPNGYDSEDFNFLKDLKKLRGEKCRIVSVGNYYEKRSLMPFLLAWKELFDSDQSYADKIEFYHYGQLDMFSEIYLSHNQLSCIHIREAIPHRDCIIEMFNADCLLLIPGPGDGTMPGKTYEYLATGNPILALVDEGPAMHLINELNAGIAIKGGDQRALVEFLQKVSKRNCIDLNSSKIKLGIKKFERKEIALQVYEAIDGLFK